MNFKGAVFDLDGTLLDSMEVWKNIDIEFLSKRGLEVPKGYKYWPRVSEKQPNIPLHGLDFRNSLMTLCMNGIKWL